MNKPASPDKIRSSKHNSPRAQTSQSHNRHHKRSSLVSQPKINYQNETKQWEETYNRIISMGTQVVPMPSIPPDSSANKRLILEEVFASVCRIALNPQDDSKYQELKEKYRNCKSKLTKLNQQCVSLNNEIIRNHELLSHHMSQVKQDEHLELNDKLQHLEVLLHEHIDLTEKQTGKSIEKKKKDKRPKTQFQYTKPNIPSYENDNTTKAIAKYRHKTHSKHKKPAQSTSKPNNFDASRFNKSTDRVSVPKSTKVEFSEEVINKLRAKGAKRKE